MRNRAYIGIGRWLLPVPGALWQRQLASAAAGIVSSNRRLMSAEHRRVHHAVVRELPRAAIPLSVERVAESTGILRDRVIPILDDLDRRMTFLVRNHAGDVTWAYPVTVDRTPHHVAFKTGERLDAA